MKNLRWFLIGIFIFGTVLLYATSTVNDGNSKISNIVLSQKIKTKNIEISVEKKNTNLPDVSLLKPFTRSFLTGEPIYLIDKNPSTAVFVENKSGTKRNGKTSFFEDFSQGIPASWLVIDVDGLTPAAAVANFTDAWIAIDNFDSSGVDTVAASTSWYNPPGQSDDWLISPAITIGPDDILQWEAKAQDPSYPDGYEIRISATTPTVPAFLSNPALFSTPAEVTAWTYRNVDLASAGYANQTVYFAVRNNSNDMFILMFDDFEIFTAPIQADLAIVEVQDVSEYTMIPGFQTRLLPLEATVSNVGGVLLTNIFMNVTVLKDGVFFDNVTSSTIPSLAVLEDTILVSSYLPPNEPGVFTFEFEVSATEPDINLSNNIDSSWVILTDQTFARDDSVMTGNISIIAGNAGELGQLFTFNSEVMVHSVDFLIQNPSSGMIGNPVYVHLRDFASTPGNVIATSDTFIVVDSTAHWITLDFDSAVHVTADSLFVGVVEIDSALLTIGYAANRFTPRAGWVVAPLEPLGTWVPIENVGLPVSVMIRVNLSLVPSSVLPDLSEALPETFALYQNYPNPFNPSTTIRFDLPSSQKVRLFVYNVLGEKVKTLLNQTMPAGKHVFYADLGTLASGVYYYRIEAGNYSSKKKMILIK